MFAHNEAAHIARCLDSVATAASDHAFTCIVLANGCTDATEGVVADYAAQHPGITLAAITRGDKSNAWNEYVHRLAPAAVVHFFLDGDCRAAPGALGRLAEALAAHPEARAAAALPASGRNRAATRAAMQRGRELAGNLYALSGEFVGRLRTRGVRLPVGLIGEDSLVGALVKWDLDPASGWRNERIVPVPEANYAFDSLSPLRRDHWQLYFNRRVRYRIRARQLEALRPIIRAQGLAGLPADVHAVYPAAVAAPGSARGLDRLFDLVAVRRMRSQIPTD